MAGIGQFGLGEGVDGSGVSTKFLTCNCSINLIIENKSKLFGLHIRPPVMEVSFGRLSFASSHVRRPNFVWYSLISKQSLIWVGFLCKILGIYL